MRLSLAAVGSVMLSACTTLPLADGLEVDEAFDFSGVIEGLAGEPTRVLVLGTTHLSQIPDDAFEKEHFSLVLDKLEAFGPDLIAIEAIGGRGCDELRRYEAIYSGVADRYCVDPSAALNALGMTQADAFSSAALMLKNKMGEFSTAERRKLAVLFLGAGEPWSAVLQWSRLDLKDRHEGDLVSKEVKTELDRRLKSRNENNVLGVNLARRLRHERVAAMDDHTADFIYFAAPESLWPTVQEVWSTEDPLKTEIFTRLSDYQGSAEKVQDGYLFMNSAAYQRATIDVDFGLAARTPDNDAVSRQYVAWWQTRGLRMAANVVEAAGNMPGSKVLVIVGASHKAYFDAYLAPMHDIEIVSVESVLTD